MQGTAKYESRYENHTAQNSWRFTKLYKCNGLKIKKTSLAVRAYSIQPHLIDFSIRGSVNGIW